ncbi:hypothetical protein BKA93DRAFT_814710 [Sparassis latifolia]
MPAKSKRARGDDDAESMAEKPVRKKKKSKSHAVSDEQVSGTDTTQVSQPAVDAAPLVEVQPVEQVTKKKKKSKGKERQEDSSGSIAPPDVDLPTSSADFISAVVAAASATSDQTQPAGAPQYDPGVHPFLEYPPELAYAYPPPGHAPPFGHPHHPPPLYPDPSGQPLPDLNFASSEELLRALQDLDFVKVASVLKSLGDAAAAANVSLNGPLVYPPPPLLAPPPVKNTPARSDAILGRPPKQKSAPPVPKNIPLPAPVEVDNPEHAHMLSHVWMNASKLAEMVKNEGLVYKKGKFSAIEEAQLTAAIENYRVNKGLTTGQLTGVIFSKEKGRDEFWTEISELYSSSLHLRPIIAVYHHVRRTYHPMKQQGKWMPQEDVALVDAVRELGQQWEKVSARVGRMSSDCRDRYRNHLENRELRQTGAWTKEEEEDLTRIVTEMTIEQGKDMDNDIFWGVVSQRMGGRRGRQQCRIKWTDSLSLQIKNMGEKPRWSQMDAYILVHKVDSMNVRDDSEIDWKQLPDEHWNVWSAHALQRRWVTLKRSIKGHEEMTHAEIMEILKTKKAQSPPPPTSKRKTTSAAAVIDGDESDGIVADVAQLQAGSSTGPGTVAGAVGV